MDPVLFFSPSFFSPYYLAPLALLQSLSIGAPMGSFRDRDVFDAISAALSATGEFADIVFGETIEQGTFGADRVPLAVLTPVHWEESDDSDPTALIRRVAYRLTIAVRDEEPGSRFDSLDRLSSLVQNTLDGTPLNGGCLPALTKLHRGQYDPTSRHPEQRLILQGEFSYIVGSFQSHSTS
jgi:hypothetical protein